MKILAICSTLCLLAFAIMGYQTGFIKLRTSSGHIISAVPVVQPEPPKARFPHALAPAARAQPVAEAADLKTTGKPVRLVILKTDGTLHPWHEKVPDEWLADAVETTQAVLVVGGQKKTLVSVKYADGTRSIARYYYELEASVIEAKTGKVLANRMFQNNPRSTKLDLPVAFQAVFNWTVAMARIGFVPEDGRQTTVVDD